VLKNVIRQAARLAGIDVFRASREPFRWSHTVEDYYPIVPKPRWQQDKMPHSQLKLILDRDRCVYESFIDDLERYADLLHGISGASGGNAPTWDNSWFSGLDAAALVGIIARYKPRRYVEIGSGNSTRFARYTVKALQLDTEIISIDPTPRAEIDQICDRTIRSPLESCDLAVFDELTAGDVVLFDGSHRAFANSDVVVFCFEVMPRLKPGVLTHLHDIFIPNDYPAAWGRRLYNEQYLLAAMLMCGEPPFRVIAPCAFICQDDALSERVKAIFKARLPHSRDIPLYYDNDARSPGVSFWLEMTR